MIQINLLTDQEISRLQAVARFHRLFRLRSYSERHPELGKMVRCHCGRRHYEAESKLCPQPVYSVVAKLGKFWRPHALKGKRLLPHHSAKMLQLVQRTQDKFPEFQPFFSDAKEAMKEARTEVQRELKKERKAEAKRLRKQHRLARRINFGLARPGSRP